MDVPCMPPIYRAHPQVIPMAPYREPEVMTMAELKRLNHLIPEPGDEEEWVYPIRVEGRAEDALSIRSVTLHPVAWIEGFDEMIRVTRYVGMVRLCDDPLAEVETVMLALAEGQPGPPAEPLMDVEIRWVDGYQYRAPVPLARHQDGSWETPGIAESFIRYSTYFSGRDDWTTWNTVASICWGRVLANVPTEAREQAERLITGPYALFGGQGWQEAGFGSILSDPHGES